MYLKQQIQSELGISGIPDYRNPAPPFQLAFTGRTSKSPSKWLFPLIFSFVSVQLGYYFQLFLVFFPGRSGFDVYCSLHSRQFAGRGLSSCFEQMGSSSLETGSVQPWLMAPRRMLRTRLLSGGGLEQPPVGYQRYTKVFLTTDSKPYSFSQGYFWSCILVLFVPCKITETCCVEITDKGAEKWRGREENWAVSTSSPLFFLSNISLPSSE